MTKQRLTSNQLGLVAEACPSGKASLEADGIRITAYVGDDGDIKIIGEVMTFALAYGLEAWQVVNNSTFTAAYSYSEYTSGGGYGEFDVKLLFDK